MKETISKLTELMEGITKELEEIEKKEEQKEKDKSKKPYIITFIVDKDNEDYIQHLPYIYEGNQQDYINRLIKQDMVRVREERLSGEIRW